MNSCTEDSESVNSGNCFWNVWLQWDFEDQQAADNITSPPGSDMVVEAVGYMSSFMLWIIYSTSYFCDLSKKFFQISFKYNI
jgi:hypothetical protein